MIYSVNVERVGLVRFLATLNGPGEPVLRIVEAQTELGAIVALSARIGRCPVISQASAFQAVENYLKGLKAA